MRTRISCNAACTRSPDPDTDIRLLPPALRRGDNSRRLMYCRRALREAMEQRLTPKQRENLELYYWKRMRKSDIALHQNSTCSAVTKSIETAHRLIREYVETYMRIYDSVEKELLSDDV